MASQAPRRNGIPPRLETNISSAGRAPNPRFSFAVTPTQYGRSNIELSSSPTTTIEDTPTSTQADMPPVAQSTRAADGSPYFEQRLREVLASPTAPPPQELHPANFAPFADEEAATEQRPSHHLPANLAPRQATPAPMKTKEDSADLANGLTATQLGGIDKPGASPVVLSPRTPIYNPQSLGGPNRASDIHIPGQVSHPKTHISPQWKHGLCVPDALCCLGLFCPCTLYGKTQYRLGQKTRKKEATDLLGYEAINGSCMLMTFACGLQGVLAAIQRTRVRKLYHIDGSVGDDCIMGLCCCCCVLEQNEREIRERADMTRTTTGMTNTPYVSPGAMSYPPPPR